MTWPCEAYGEAGLTHGALCFRSAELHRRVCTVPSECSTFMGWERQRVFDLMQQDPVMRDQFTSPEQLLGGKGDPDASTD